VQNRKDVATTVSVIFLPASLRSLFIKDPI
jgi:hypothetical protein